MSAPKYTPGPWAVSWTEDEGHRVEPGIAMLWRHHEADARLIAAAPEMLAAKWALQFMKVPSGVQNFTLIEALERSIAKAEGRE